MAGAGGLSKSVARWDPPEGVRETPVLPPVRGEPDVTESSVRNQLLAALPRDVLSRLLPGLHPVLLTLRKSLMTPDAAIETVYFVESGWVSLVQVLEDGSHAEVGIV